MKLFVQVIFYYHRIMPIIRTKWNLEEVVLLLSTRETPPNPESSRFSRQFLMVLVVASLDMVLSSISGNSLSINRVLELVLNRGVGLLLLVVGDIVLEMLLAVDNNDILVNVLLLPVDILLGVLPAIDNNDRLLLGLNSLLLALHRLLLALQRLLKLSLMLDRVLQLILASNKVLGLLLAEDSASDTA